MSAVPPPMPEPLWTVREAAAFLRLGRNTVYEWAATGKLPSLRLGSRIRSVPSVLRLWVAVQRGPEAPAAVAGLRRT
jgi:excisionase family DNA binding protein